MTSHRPGSRQIGYLNDARVSLTHTPTKIVYAATPPPDCSTFDAKSDCNVDDGCEWNADTSKCKDV